MSDLSAGRAYVEVVPSLKDFHKKNAAEMRRVGAEARKAFNDGFTSGKAPAVPTPDPKQSREKGRQSGEQFAGAFDREVRTKVTAALKSLPDAQIGADATDAEREVAKVRASLERLSKQRIGVDIDEATALNRLESLQRRLQELGASDDATIGVKANTTQAALQLDKIRVSAEAVGALSPTVTVDADTAAAEAKIAAVSSVSASAGASGLVTSALLLGPALIPGAAAATAGVAGLGAAGAAGGAGLGVAAFALAGVSDAVTALGEAQKTQGKTAEQVAAANEKAAAAMAGLSPEGRKFATFINGLRGTISDLQADAARGFLPGLQEGMDAAGKALSPFRGIVGSLAKDMGGLMTSAGKGLGGDAFQRFFTMVEKTGGPTLRLLGGIIGDIAKAFAGLAVAFQPVATQVLTGLKRLTERFAAFANEGQGGGLSKFVDYVRENGPKVAAMIGSLARAFGRVIVAIAPFGEKVVAVIKSVSDRIAGLPIGTLRKLIGTIVGLTLAWKAATLAAAAIASVQRVWAAALAATTFVTKAAAVAQRLLNAAMRMNPIGIVITALIALGAVMVLAYKKSETFRRIVDAAWAGIKRAALATVAWFKDVAWPWMRDALQWIGDKAMWLWRNGIKPAFGFIWGIAKTVFGWMKNTGWPMVNGVFSAIVGGALWLWGKVRSVFNFLKRGFETVAAVATWLGKVVLGVVIVAIWALFKWLWSKVKPVFAAIRSGLSAVGRAGRWLYENALRPAFMKIAAVAKWLWNMALKPALNWIKGGFTLLKDKAKWLWTWVKRYFQAVADNAKWLWGKVQWALNKIKSGFGLLVDKTKWLRDWIKRYFQAIKANADWLWDKVKLAFDKLKDGVSAVKKAFGDAKDGIGRAWGKIYGKITGPIKKALRWLNKNLIGKLNSLLRDVPGVKFRIEPIDTSGFDTGGYTGPGHYKKPAGLVHAGEMVIKKDSTNKLRKSIGMSGLNYMNRTGELPAGGYAGGGIVDLGKRLQRMGYDVSEHPAFGGVVPGAHAANGYHYKGGALDINADPWNSRFNRETSALDSLNRMLRGEGWNTIWRAPNHWDHLHVDIGNGQGGGGGLGLGFLKKFLPDWAKDLADGPAKFIRSRVAGFMDNMPGGGTFGLAGKILPGMIGEAAKGLAGKVASVFDLSKLLDKFVPGFLSGGDKGGGGTDRWRGTVMRALGMLGLPSSLAGTTLRRMAQESGGDPRAINKTDSNWLRGTPSKGLMQVIDPTFRAHAYPGRNDIWNPLDNILASMRYALARYGSLPSAYNRAGGYSGGGLVTPAVFDNGGTLAPGPNLVWNNLGKPEPLVRPEHAMAGGATFILKDSDGVLLGVIRGEIQDNDEFKASVGRMGHG